MWISVFKLGFICIVLVDNFVDNLLIVIHISTGGGV